MSTKERLYQFLANNDITARFFENEVGLGNGFVSKVGFSIRKEKLDMISNKYPELNINWLLTGEGEMLKGDKLKYSEVIEVNPDIKMVPLVSQYAYAGYLSGYSDAEYIDTLPVIPVFVDRELKGTYRAFEVRGDSMDDGTRDSICQGDRLICRQIKQELWQYKFHMLQWNFIIVHKTEGILVKRIINHNTETGIITLHSLNPIYEDMQIQLNDVAQMFNVVEVHRGGRI